jgi:organic hydroperoxide reductase OsmC/OhrA
LVRRDWPLRPHQVDTPQVVDYLCGMSQQHEYTSSIVWTGNRGAGTREFRGYDRLWEVRTPGKPVITCSNDPLLGGDPSKPNPEDMLLSALSACHMLWFLHLACVAGIVVTGYEDTPAGIGETTANGAGRFVSATLHPKIRLPSKADRSRADALHAQIHEYCFIARSVNFPISCTATYGYEAQEAGQ